MTAHHRFGPSGLARIMQCAWSATAEAACPDFEDDTAAREGDAAHWVAVTMARTGSKPDVGALAPNGVTITDEMVECATEYVNYLFRINNGRRVERFFENTINLSTLWRDLFGTPDYYGVEASTGVIDLVDFKFGHREVAAFENWQLLAYAAGISGRIFRLHIVQPRCYTAMGITRMWEIDAKTVTDYATRIRHQLVNASSLSHNHAKTGPECRNCKARFGCSAAMQQTQWIEDYVTNPVLRTFGPEAAGLELTLLQRAREALEARIGGIEAWVKYHIFESRQKVPGWTVEQGQGREQWALPADQVGHMGQMMGVELLQAPTPITPNQARKQFKAAGLDGSFVDTMTRRSPGEWKVKPATTDKARAVFARLPQNDEVHNNEQPRQGY